MNNPFSLSFGTRPAELIERPLQNEKSLTFLYRTPKIQLTPLNYSAIAETYQKVLQIGRKQAVEMAKLTKGYAFAFQVLGYFTFREKAHDYKAVIAATDYTWMSLSMRNFGRNCRERIKKY